MWDARGKTEGVPLHVLLGGAVRMEIPLTEYFSYRLPGANHPGDGSPGEIARFCAAMIEQHGATDFEGKVAIVTGAGGGLGHCHALQLAPNTAQSPSAPSRWHRIGVSLRCWKSY